MIAVRKQRKNKNLPRKASKVQAQLKQQVLRELKKETAARNNRQKKILSKRPRRQKKYQNLSGVQGTRQNQGFGNKKRIVVSETEYIGEVTVANQPNYQNLFSLPVNPGQATTFPWLSAIAKNYEKYCFRELTFFYKPEVTEYTTNTNTGKVILSADYDASDAPPATKQQQEDVDPHADGMPYQTISLTLDPKELHQNSVARFVRIGGLPGSADIKTYDAANFFLACSGQTANNTIGELHVRYVVELSIPLIEDTVQAPANNSVSQFAQAYTTAGATTVATTIPFTAAINANPLTANGLGIVNGLNVVNATGVFTPPVGNYLINLQVQTYNDSAEATGFLVNFYKNAAFYPAITNATAQFGAVLDNSDDIEKGIISQMFYISCNGTDTFQTALTCTYSGGNQDYSALLTIIAI